jgi:hypothetical protein
MGTDMAFIVETGTGLANAESYISVEDAEDYIAAYAIAADVTLWDALADADKEKALRIGTQYLDLCFRFRSVKSTQTQALAWPRIGVQDDEGYYFLDSSQIPECVKRATVEAALRHVAGDNLLGAIAKPGVIESQSVTIGPLQKSTTYQGGQSPVPEYPKIRALLKQVIEASNTMERC